MFWHPEPEAMAINASSLTWNKNYFCKFPPFSLAGQVLAKIHRDKTHAVIVVPDWSTQYWYPQLIQMTNQDPLYFRPSPRNSTLPHHPLYKKLQLIAIRVIILQKKNLETSLRLSTHCKYNNYIKQWTSYSKNVGRIEVSHVLDFLSGMFDKGHAYSTINSTKCAIATIVHIPPYNSLNKHPLINKYMTGVFNLRPPKPKLSFVWDVNILFRYFEQQGDNDSLSDKLLTQKLLILLLLLGA